MSYDLNNNDFLEYLETAIAEETVNYLTEDDLEDSFSTMFDECYPMVQFGDLSYSPSEVLAKVDPIAFRCEVANHSSEYVEFIDKSGCVHYFDEHELDMAWNDFEDEQERLAEQSQGEDDGPLSLREQQNEALKNK